MRSRHDAEAPDLSDQGLTEAVSFGAAAARLVRREDSVTERLCRAVTLLGLMCSAQDPQTALMLAWPWLRGLIEEAGR